MVTVDKLMSAIYKLSKPLQEKALKKLGLSTTGTPGRKGDGIVVGRDRVRIEKKIDQLKGGAKGIGAATIIHELLGISSVGDATMPKAKAADRPKSKTGTYKPAPGTAYAPKEGPSKSQSKKPPIPKKLPKPKPNSKNESKVKFDTTGTLSKSRGGSTDYRVGGMVKSTVDNRKNK